MGWREEKLAQNQNLIRYSLFANLVVEFLFIGGVTRLLRCNTYCMRLCIHCQEEKEEILFRKGKRSKLGRMNICKKCSNLYQSKKREGLSQEKKLLIKDYDKKRNKEKYKTFSNDLNKNLIPLEKRIKMWIDKKIGDNTKTSDRKCLDKNTLYKRAIKALEFFPYLIFWNKRNSGSPMLFTASIDRVENFTDYSNENSVIVPLWLNFAKGIGTYDELFECIKSFLDYENL